METNKNKLIFFALIALLLGLWRFSVNNPKLHNGPAEMTRASYTDISAPEALSLLKQNPDTFLIDVHIPEQDHLAQTDAFIPFDRIKEKLDRFPEDKDTPILVYCRSGNMSQEASQELIDNGFKNVYNLSGGLHAWQGAGIPINWK